MHQETLIRAAGLAAIICGALTLLFWLLHPVAGDPSAPHNDAYWQALTSGRYAAVNTSFLVIILTSLLALPGVYARQSDASGRYQCNVLREAAPEPRRGEPVQPLTPLKASAAQKLDARLRVVREADLAHGRSHVLHDVILRMMTRMVEEDLHTGGKR
jgi:hypothetical protein